MKSFKKAAFVVLTLFQPAPTLYGRVLKPEMINPSVSEREFKKHKKKVSRHSPEYTKGEIERFLQTCSDSRIKKHLQAIANNAKRKKRHRNNQNEWYEFLGENYFSLAYQTEDSENHSIGLSLFAQKVLQTKEAKDFARLYAKNPNHFMKTTVTFLRFHKQ